MLISETPDLSIDAGESVTEQNVQEESLNIPSLELSKRSKYEFERWVTASRKREPDIFIRDPNLSNESSFDHYLDWKK